MTSQQAFENARQLLRSGRLQEAEALYRQVLAAEPQHSEAWHHLGLIAHRVGDQRLAIRLVSRTLELRPENATAHSNLGEIYRAAGLLEEAEASLRRALELAPGHPSALSNLGLTLTARSRFGEAATVFRRVLEQKDDVRVRSNLAYALVQKGEIEEALAQIRRAVEIDPLFADAQNSLGVVLVAHGQREEAIAALQRAVALDPHDPEFHWNLALALLSTGRFKEGWEQYGWRGHLKLLARPDLTMPAWNGEDLSGRTLLVHQEGGFGDVLHFIRYLPLIVAGGVGRIVFEGKAAILPLMKLQPGIDDTVERGQPLPEYDFHCAPPSWPRLFGTEMHNIPAAIPYLKIDGKKQAVWRDKLSAPPCRDGNAKPFLVGLCWAGSAQPTDYRSRTLETFAPLAGVPGVTFVSLQKGAEAAQVAHPPAGMKLVDAAVEVEDFSDLAALVSCLDAVATVDTAVAHLAGALGIPTWILIPWQPDFRWLLEREDSPWYPTARLFRQSRMGDWEEAVERIAILLRERAI